MGMTANLQKKLGDLVLFGTAWTMPSVYLALFSASPGESGSLASEFSGGSYARVALTAKMGAANATTGIAVSTADATFPAPTGAWGSMAYAGIVDAASGGNVLFYEPTANQKVINNGDAAPLFSAGTITVSIVGAQAIMLTSYLMKKLVDKALGKADYLGTSGVFHGLLASNPTIAGTMSSEVAVGGYVRQPLTAVFNAFDASTGVAATNTDVTYPTPTADYPTVNYDFVADAVSAGNMLFATQLASPLSIRSGGFPALFPAGATKMIFA